MSEENDKTTMNSFASSFAIKPHRLDFEWTKERGSRQGNVAKGKSHFEEVGKVEGRTNLYSNEALANDYASNLELRERLSDRDIDYLEVKANLIKENKTLREELAHREQQLVSREMEVRKIYIKVHQDEAEMASKKAHHDLQMMNLTRKVQSCLQEINKLNQEVRRNSAKSSKSEVEFKQKVASRDSQILQYKRQIEVLEGQLEETKDKLDAKSREFSQVQESKQSFASQLADLRARVQMFEKHLDSANARCLDLEIRVEKVREERDRAEDLASQSRIAMERVQGLLDKERLHFAALKDEYQELKHTKEEMRRNEMSPRNATVPRMLQYSQNHDEIQIDEQSTAKQVAEMRAELRSCMVQLKEWRKRVQDTEAKNKTLKQKLQESLLKLASTETGKLQDPASTESQELSCDGEGLSSVNASDNDNLPTETLVKRYERKVADLESRRTQAEWDRVETEKKFSGLQKSFENAKDELHRMVKQVEVLTTTLEKSEEARRSIEEDNQKLLETLAEAEVEIDKLANQVGEKDHEGEAMALNNLMLNLNVMIPCVKQLCGLLESCLNQEEPTMEMLLDEVIASEAVPMTVSRESLEYLSTKVAQTTETVSEARSRLADNYAHQLGKNDCQVQ